MEFLIFNSSTATNVESTKDGWTRGMDKNFFKSTIYIKYYYNEEY